MQRDKRGRMPPLHGYDAAEVSKLYGVETGSDTRVQQHFADEVDINTIMRRFGVTGQTPLGSDAGFYGDFTGIEDYESALARVREAQSKFMALPPEVRERFGNDPGRLIYAAQNAPESDFVSAFKPNVVEGAAGEPAVVPPVSSEEGS